MKTNLRFFVLVLLVLVATSQVFAQGRRGQIELYAGAGFPLGPQEFKDIYKVGFSLNGQYVFFPSPKVGIPIFAGYEFFSVDNNAVNQLFVNELNRELTGTGISVVSSNLDVSGSASIIRFGAGVRPYLSDPTSSTQFFLFGNATYNIIKDKAELKGGTVTLEDEFGSTETFTIDEPFSEENNFNKFGIAGGLGVEIPAGSSLNLIFQGLYNMIFTEGESTSFVGVTAGLVF